MYLHKNYDKLARNDIKAYNKHIIDVIPSCFAQWIASSEMKQLYRYHIDLEPEGYTGGAYGS